MALTITEKFRATMGGKAWRTYEIVHDSGTTKSISAASMDLDYIDAIIGSQVNVSMVAAASNVIDMNYCSIAANNQSLIWASTIVCTQTITIIGW